MIVVSKVESSRYSGTTKVEFNHGTTIHHIYEALQQRLGLVPNMAVTANETTVPYSYVTQPDDRIVFRLSTKDNG